MKCLTNSVLMLNINSSDSNIDIWLLKKSDFKLIPPALLLQEDLNEIRDVWNAHRIRTSKNTNVPSGIPEVMYLAPHLWGAEDLIIPFNDDLTTCKESCKFLTSVPCDEDMFDLCTIIMEESGLEFPTSRSQALELYLSLRDIVRPLIATA